jgi:hypothetical protein
LWQCSGSWDACYCKGTLKREATLKRELQTPVLKYPLKNTLPRPRFKMPL